VADTLHVSWDGMVTAAMELARQSAQLGTELEAIQREWDELSAAWRGEASATYAKLWQQWSGGAKQVVAVLDESCELLQRAARTYTDQDEASADVIGDVEVEPMW